MQLTFFIDVVGDSLASLAASGLTEAFADKPEIAVADKSHDASGLVRADYFDWPKAAHDLATGKDHIDFVVVMVGINDLQAMRDGADNLDPLSDRWKAAYTARIDAVLAPFQAANIPVAWVGMPPMRTDRFNADIVKLNEIDRAEVEKQGVKYIDIWDAFADQNGQYDASGPNVDGQIVKLRGPDGIHFTKAGGRKVAHFLEAEIRRVFDKGRPHRAGGGRHQRPDSPRDGGPRGAGRAGDAGAAQTAGRTDPVADRTPAFARRRARLARADPARRDRPGGAGAASGRARRSAQRPRRRFLLAAALSRSAPPPRLFGPTARVRRRAETQGRAAGS